MSQARPLSEKTKQRIDSIVVTSIASPNQALKDIAAEASARDVPFYVIGDRKSPAHFELEGCRFFSLESQKALPFHYAQVCPEASYARKNIGYLLAISNGSQVLLETDDDNLPISGFLSDRSPVVIGRQPQAKGWINAYAYFSDTHIWPRGFPLEKIQHSAAAPVREETAFCPMQQGLANENPDVDAVYRLVLPLPVCFRKESPLVLGSEKWCPFNTQNTVTFREAFPLLYLPATCSFRMTDIWRSFVAQRILWACGWGVSFHQATMRQERNEHNLLRDFADEVPGYLNNARIANALEKLPLRAGPEAMPDNLRACYDELLRLEVIKPAETPLLSAWLEDLQDLTSSPFAQS